jgi:hypothetical protein
MEVRKLEETNLFEVQSQRRPDQYYTVDTLERTCSCPHYRYTGTFCKHLRAAEYELELATNRALAEVY